MTEAEYAAKERARQATTLMNRAIDRLADNYWTLDTLITNWPDAPANWGRFREFHDKLTAFRNTHLERKD